MRKYFLFALGLAILVGVAPAQPQDGDLIIANFRDPLVKGSYGPGSILGVNPSTGAVATIASSLTTVGTTAMGPNWIEMASDNTNFMVGFLPSAGTAPAQGVYMHSVSPAGGILKTLIADTGTAWTGDYINAFDLDYDGTWVIAGGYGVWTFNENTFSYSTVFNTSLWTRGQVNALCLNRGPGAPGIVTGLFNLGTSTNPHLFGINRQGKSTSIVAQGIGGPSYVSAVRMDWYTGNYICTGFGIDANGGGGEFVSVTPKGVLTSLNVKAKMYRANGLYVDKQRMAYVLCYDLQSTPVPTLTGNYLCAIYKMDLAGNFVSMYTYNPLLIRDRFAASGITEYGSRHVVCNGSGLPGTSVSIKFSSRKASDAGKAYRLAASFNHVGGPRLPNGEFLDLSFDTLMFVTVQNLLPSVFKNFVGILDASGNATASVAIPANFPAKTNIPIFVSGIVVDPKAPGGVSTVGNTHWFVLN